MCKVLYIAETNSAGRIESVWVSRPEARSATPFSATRHMFDSVEPAEFSGSKPAEIIKWLAARQSTGMQRRETSLPYSRKNEEKF